MTSVRQGVTGDVTGRNGKIGDSRFSIVDLVDFQLNIGKINEISSFFSGSCLNWAYHYLNKFLSM